MCDAFYDYTRDYLLSKFDWTFARKLQKLNEVVLTTPVPSGTYAYELPNDCKVPRDVHPLGSRESWLVMGNQLYCKIPPETGVYLYYTYLQTDTSTYPETFSNLLSLGLAARICAPITQDKKLAKLMYEMYQTEILEVMEVDSNIGNVQPANDNNPDADSFVNPEFGGYETGF